MAGSGDSGEPAIAVTRGSGDAEALAGFGVAAEAGRALDWNAGAAVTGAAETAEGVVGGADTVGTGGAFAFTGRGIRAGAIEAGTEQARIGLGAVGVRAAFDRGAVTADARFADSAIGVGAAIASRADG